MRVSPDSCAYTRTLARTMFWLTLARLRWEAFEDLVKRFCLGRLRGQPGPLGEHAGPTGDPDLEEWQRSWNLAYDWIGRDFLRPQVSYWSDYQEAFDKKMCCGRLNMLPQQVGPFRGVPGPWSMQKQEQKATPTATVKPPQWRIPVGETGGWIVYGLRGEDTPEVITKGLLETVVQQEKELRSSKPSTCPMEFLPENLRFGVTIGETFNFVSGWYVCWGEGKQAARERIRGAFREQSGGPVPRVFDRELTAYLARVEKEFGKSVQVRRFRSEHFAVLVRRTVPKKPNGKPTTWEDAAETTPGGQEVPDCSAKVRDLARFIGIDLPRRGFSKSQAPNLQ